MRDKGKVRTEAWDKLAPGRDSESKVGDAWADMGKSEQGMKIGGGPTTTGKPEVFAVRDIKPRSSAPAGNDDPPWQFLLDLVQGTTTTTTTTTPPDPFQSFLKSLPFR